MANRAAVAALALACAGALAIGASVASGATHVYLLVIVPVLAGASALFLVGVLFAVMALVLFAISIGNWEESKAEPETAARGAPTEGSSTGGFLLIGPVPIFFGAARSLDDRYYWIAVAAGVALFATFAAVFYFG
jgi:uncharacterized membrane protein